MNKSVLLIFVFLVILTSSFTVPHSLLPLAVEGQTVNNKDNTLNVTDLTNSSTLNSTLQLQNKTVEYYKNTSGYLVYPTISSPGSNYNNNTNSNNDTFPAVIMIHENKGLNDNIKNMANLLAKEGYVVLAVDLFNGEVTTNQTRASELTQSIRDNPDVAITNLKSAVTFLASLPNVNPDKIASLGWCFGGQQSLQLALNSEDHPLAATVIYYGRLVTEPETLSKIKWPVLGIFGDQDTSIPVKTVEQFEEALTQNGITNEIYIYKGVGHAFANPSGENYAPNETKNAWEKTLSFLNKYL
ncbi:MAG: dienelactone hydrolase family protein [Nitrososphaeraceae archaeon]